MANIVMAYNSYGLYTYGLHNHGLYSYGASVGQLRSVPFVRTRMGGSACVDGG